VTDGSCHDSPASWYRRERPDPPVPGTANEPLVSPRGPFTQCVFSSSGYSAVITRRSRAIAPFDGTYVVQPLSPSTRLKYLKLTQSSRLYEPGLPSNARASRLVDRATQAPALLRRLRRRSSDRWCSRLLP
jgi:hypothetical protein